MCSTCKLQRERLRRRNPQLRSHRILPTDINTYSIIPLPFQYNLYLFINILYFLSENRLKSDCNRESRSIFHTCICGRVGNGLTGKD